MINHPLTLAKSNKFSFKCPVMNAEVQMRGCVLLRDKVYVGQKLQTRRGCQACISGGKCPAAEIVRRFAFGANNATDHCSSEEPKVGRLPADVLDRIAAVIVPEGTLRSFGVPAEEVLLITNSRERIDQQILTAPRERVESRVRKSEHHETPKRRSSAPAPATKPAAPKPQINHAAATGDMAAALNAA